MANTTFGYSAPEDRLWMTGSGWEGRLWLTRRTTIQLMKAVSGILENLARQDPTGATAGDVHDAALNQPQPGETVKPIQMGQERAEVTREAHYALCASMYIISLNDSHTLVFKTTEDDEELRMEYSAIGLHRWLHALHVIAKQTNWNLNSHLPEWLMRSYLPKALQNMLAQPLPDKLDGDEDEAAPPPAP